MRTLLAAAALLCCLPALSPAAEAGPSEPGVKPAQPSVARPKAGPPPSSGPPAQAGARARPAPRAGEAAPEAEPEDEAVDFNYVVELRFELRGSTSAYRFLCKNGTQSNLLRTEPGGRSITFNTLPARSPLRPGWVDAQLQIEVAEPGNGAKAEFQTELNLQEGVEALVVEQPDFKVHVRFAPQAAK